MKAGNYILSFECLEDIKVKAASSMDTNLSIPMDSNIVKTAGEYETVIACGSGYDGGYDPEKKQPRRRTEGSGKAGSGAWRP